MTENTSRGVEWGSNPMTIMDALSIDIALRTDGYPGHLIQERNEAICLLAGEVRRLHHEGETMRIDIYQEELTDDIVLVEKRDVTGEDGSVTFYGVRFFLESSPLMHQTEHDDDDRSAVTFWCRAGGIPRLANRLSSAINAICEA